MSSYLTIYAKVKGVEKPSPMISWSRNNKVYQSLVDHIAYIGNGDKMQFTELTVDLINIGIEDLKTDIKDFEKYLVEYEKHAGTNDEYIPRIVELKEEIEDCNSAISILLFVRDLVEELKYGYPDDDNTDLIKMESYLANID